ncbi:hypothetical protein BJX99DRAFT_220007 [Aspergillus californicus]
MGFVHKRIRPETVLAVDKDTATSMQITCSCMVSPHRLPIRKNGRWKDFPPREQCLGPEPVLSSWPTWPTSRNRLHNATRYGQSRSMFAGNRTMAVSRCIRREY